MVEGVAVHTTGAGPAVVLLHANGGDHRDFEAVVDHVAQTATVHAVDWPGHGDSPPMPAPGACEYADLLPAVLDQLDGGPFLLVGNSVGGFAALRTAARRPDLVRGLVLIDTGGFTPRWPGTLVACRAIASSRVAPRAMRVLPRLYLRRSTPAVAAVRSRAVEASRSADQVRTFSAIWRSFTERDHDARGDAAAVTVPTLLAWGTRDPVLPWWVDGRRARRALAQADVATFSCGHQPHVEVPDDFVAAFDRFAATLEVAAP